ncbi:hypothetical protein ACZ75_10725 [Massilia sp. NR 4-1]|nr:hypothetical protein ACZ75_10725 [Massilia sp. NR 4-1]
MTGTPVWWVDQGPTNKWAIFDNEVNTQTEQEKELTYTVQPGVFNAIYLAGLDADVVSVTAKDRPGGEVIFFLTDILEASKPDDYWEYFFGPFRPQRDYLVQGIDQYAKAELTVKLTRASGLVKCGVIAVGDLKPLGATQYGAKAKPRTNSRIKTDDFGKTSVKRRPGTKDFTASAWLKLSEANSVLLTLLDTMDVPCAWIGLDLPEYAGLRAFGLGSGEISYDHQQDCQLTVNIQGYI